MYTQAGAKDDEKREEEGGSSTASFLIIVFLLRHPAESQCRKDLQLTGDQSQSFPSCASCKYCQRAKQRPAMNQRFVATREREMDHTMENNNPLA